MTFIRNTEHEKEAKENLVSQFKNKANIAALLDAFVSEIQELETVLFDLLLNRLDLQDVSGTSTSVGIGFLEDTTKNFTPNTLTNFTLQDSVGQRFRIVSNTSTRINFDTTQTPAAGTYSAGPTTGEQLDGIGRILDVDRSGQDDDDYRATLRNKIVAIGSFGTLENIVSVILNSSGRIGIPGTIDVTDIFPAGFSTGGDGAVWDTIDNAQKAFLLAESVKPAGVELVFLFSLDTDLQFTFSGSVSGGGFDNDLGTEPTAGEFVGVFVG